MMNIKSMGGVTLSLMAAVALAMVGPTLPAFASGGDHRDRHSGHSERHADRGDHHAGRHNGHHARHHERHHRRHHRHHNRHAYGHYNGSGFGLTYYSNHLGLADLAGVALLATAVELGRSDSYRRDREVSRREDRYDHYNRDHSPAARDYPINYDPVDALLDRSAELDLSYRQIQRLRRLQDDHLRETDHLVERLTFARRRLQRLRNDRYTNSNDVRVARDRVVSLEERLQRTHARHEGHVNELLRAHRADRLSRR